MLTWKNVSDMFITACTSSFSL